MYLPNGGSQISGAKCKESQSVVVRKFQLFSQGINGPDQSPVNLAHVSALLHGDDPQVILLGAPNQKGLVLVEEDSPALGPIPVGVGSGQESVALLEQEVLIDESPLLVRIHPVQRLVHRVFQLMCPTETFFLIY